MSVQLERLRRVCQISAPVFRHEHHVLDAYGAETGIVETWLDRDDMAFLKQRSGSADARHFMNIESDPVASAVKVALHAPIDQTSLVAGFLKSVQDSLMNPLSVRPVLDLRDSLFLGIQHLSLIHISEPTRLLSI